VGFQTRLAQTLYDFLDIGKVPRLSDCIFVLAGNQERKLYGIRMWRVGYAPQLILSVRPLESRQLSELELESEGFESLAYPTFPEKKPFFLRLDRQDMSCIPIQRSEARALADYFREMPLRSLLVVTSPVHMRRTALMFRRAFRKSKVQLTFATLPENMPSSREIWSEFFRYFRCLLFHF
jgi:hypothetical protein